MVHEVRLRIGDHALHVGRRRRAEPVFVVIGPKHHRHSVVKVCQPLRCRFGEDRARKDMFPFSIPPPRHQAGEREDWFIGAMDEIRLLELLDFPSLLIYALAFLPLIPAFRRH